MSNSLDPKKLSFSQAWGYEKLPSPLKLEEISREARTHLWNNLYQAVGHSLTSPYGYEYYIDLPPWHNIFRDLHAHFFNFDLDTWDRSHKIFIRRYKNLTYTLEFNKVFDLFQYIMRHPECPSGFINEVAETFNRCHFAYVVCKEPPATIFPAITEVEGKRILEALKQLHDNSLTGAETHLRNASDFINQGKYADSIHESINSVESVARRLDPNASNSLDKALKALEKGNPVHPALKEALLKLYGYTSDEKGIRHSLIDESQANVGIDEAIFMLGACASFSSYLLRKHKAG